jgi:hypothetical protein
MPCNCSHMDANRRWVLQEAQMAASEAEEIYNKK